MWQFTAGQDFTLGNSLFGAVKLTKNVDFDKSKYSGNVIGYDLMFQVDVFCFQTVVCLVKK